MKRLRAIIRILFSKEWILLTSKSPHNNEFAVDYKEHYRYPKAAPADIMVELLKSNTFYTISTLRIEADRLERSWYKQAM